MTTSERPSENGLPEVRPTRLTENAMFKHNLKFSNNESREIIEVLKERDVALFSEVESFNTYRHARDNMIMSILNQHVARWTKKANKFEELLKRSQKLFEANIVWFSEKISKYLTTSIRLLNN